MPESETLIFRASLTQEVYRAFEIAETRSLYDLAAVIVTCFDFDFDHAFGFYSRLKGNILASPVRYELFADQGHADDRVRGVKRTPIRQAFPTVGKRMSFLFDYGDEWIFEVKLVARKPKESKVKLPRLISSSGQAPEQYPEPEDD